MADRIARISAAGLAPDDFVRRYVAENEPVILQGALPKGWAHAQSWTPDVVAGLAPDGARVRVAPLDTEGCDKWIESADLWPGALEEREPLPGVVHEDRFLAVAAERIEIAACDFAAALRGEMHSLPALYADGAQNAVHSFGFLAETLPGTPAVGNSLLFKHVDLWLGGRTRSTLHYDNVENLFAQLVGDKEFLLCPPGDTTHLVDGRLRKAYKTWRGADATFERTSEGISSEAVLNYAAYDIHDPPPQYAERAGKLRRQIVRVHSGEVLYLPFGWWHQVSGVPGEHGLCASASCYFEPFFVRLQPKALTRPGPLLPNPKYRKLCERLGLDDSSDEEDKKPDA